MKLLYDIAACITTILLIIPVSIWAGFVAMYEVFKQFPHNVIEIFDRLYEER